MRTLEVPSPSGTAVLEHVPEHIITRYSREFELNRAEAEARFREMLRFLQCCADERGAAFAPSKVVDEAWHTFLLHTSDYWRYCREVLGGFIHHQPSDAPESGAYERTLSALARRFGQPDERYWPTARAGNCNTESECYGNCSNTGGCTGRCSSDDGW